MYRTVIVMALCGPLMAGAQSHPRKITEQSSPKKQTMDLSKITHPNVRKAIEALQAGDKSWYSFFADQPVMTDDGNTVDFKSFFGKALGHEKFLSIDKVENEGKEVYGNFKAGSWGTFKVFFKFHEGAGGKFDRLDIGQTKY
ncbi:hypothetical protein [Chitinophaga oryzae]|nr:hypothetical protein [Chitinophaga oryzae]